MRRDDRTVSLSSVFAAAQSSARIPALRWELVDLVTAGLLVLLSVAVLAGSGQPLSAVALGVLGSGAVAARGRAPALATMLVVLVAVLVSGIDHGAQTTVLGIAAALCFYSFGVRPAPRTVVDVLLLGGALGAVARGREDGVIGVVVSWMLFAAIPYLGGRTVCARRALTLELRLNAESVRREQEVQTRAAAAEERTRIAREIHDVVAHSLSLMVVQTVAAREVAAGDRVAALDALEAVQRCGREALLEMRQMIGVLRRGDLELAGPATPCLDQLELLAERARTAGLPVDLTVVGEPRPLPDAIELISFRIVQEALTNSIKHAGPASAVVTVTFGEETLQLEICDDGHASKSDGALEGAGRGLLGMRERLMLIEGEMTVGERECGGFRVHASLPTGRVEVS
jgi:signal transduction histidine kinase